MTRAAVAASIAVTAAWTLFDAPQASTATPNATVLYQDAIRTTKAWTVHYVSNSNSSHVPFVETGDTGPASGTQVLHIGKGTTLDSATLIVIGDLTYLKGNVLALEELADLSPTAANQALGHWVLFSSNNPMFAQVVVGVRSSDVAQEVALGGPYTLGPSRILHGYKVDALRGSQQGAGEKKMRAVLYVRSSGRPLLVEEDTLDAQGKANGAEHIIFSKWGESVKPRAPQASIIIGSINAT